MFMVLTFLNFHFKAMFVGNFTTMALEKRVLFSLLKEYIGLLIQSN